MPRDRSRFHVGPRAPSARAVGAHDHLRSARARIHDAPSGRAARAPRQVLGPGGPRGRELSEEPRHHRDRAAARAGIDRRSRDLVDKGLKNYWGYDTIGFFAPNPRYSRTGSVGGFKAMVAHLHDAGIEVILDVVYNHTPEGNERGPTLCFKGIDNASYYRLLPDQPRYYINDTGTGNTLNVSHPRVLQMVTDSLRYWVTEMHVDGFRFDLATILAREPHGFDQGGGFLDSCRQDPILSHVKLIAEPWDIGPGGYQVGRFPPGWAEWNDKYPRYRARLLERRRRQGAGPRAAPHRFRRRVQPPRPQALGERQLHHRARRLHAERPRVLQRQAQRGERRRQPRRAFQQSVVELRRRRTDRRREHSRAARASEAQPARDAALLAGHADAARRRRVRQHAERQQQRVLPGRRDHVARLAGRERGAGRAHAIREAVHRASAQVSHSAPQPVFHGRPQQGAGRKGRDVGRSARPGEDAGELERSGRTLLRDGARRPRAADRHRAPRVGCDAACSS